VREKDGAIYRRRERANGGEGERLVAWDSTLMLCSFMILPSFISYRCVNEHLKSWTEGDGTRMIEVQGTLTNKGPAAICGLTFNMVSSGECSQVLVLVVVVVVVVVLVARKSRRMTWRS